MKGYSYAKLVTCFQMAWGHWVEFLCCQTVSSAQIQKAFRSEWKSKKEGKTLKWKKWLQSSKNMQKIIIKIWGPVCFSVPVCEEKDEIYIVWNDQDLKLVISKQFLTFSTKTALLCKLLIRRSLRTCWIIPAYDYLYILPVFEDRRLHNLLIYLCDLVNVWLNWVQISKCDFPGQRLWRDNQWRC